MTDQNANTLPPMPPSRPRTASPAFARPVTGRDALVITLLALVGVVVGAAIFVGLIVWREETAPWGLGVLGVTMLAGLALGLKLRDFRARDVGLVKPARPIHLLWQIPVAWLAPLTVGGAASMLLLGPAAQETNTEAITDAAVDPGALAAAVVTAVVLAPVTEEILFRRVLLGWLEGKWGRVVAVIVTALVFGVVHGIPAVIIVMACLGASLALLTINQRSIWPSLAVHMLNNAVAATVALTLLA